MAPDSIWEIVFLMVILKIPVVYLCTVVWYAIKAKPRPGYGAGSGSQSGSDDSGPGGGRRRRTDPRRPQRPHGGPSRVYVRTPAGSVAGRADDDRRNALGRRGRPKGRTAMARAGRVGRR